MNDRFFFFFKKKKINSESVTKNFHILILTWDTSGAKMFFANVKETLWLVAIDVTQRKKYGNSKAIEKVSET